MLKFRQYTHSFLMTLKHAFEKKGNILFKYRGQIPMVLFVGAIPAIYFSDIQTIESIEWLEVVLLITCALVSFIGQVIRSIAIGTSRKQTSGRNTWGHEAKALNSTGIYSVVRHPLYLGNFFMWMGIVCYTGNVWYSIVVALLFWIYYERIMFSEEVFLEQEFGQDFVDWSMRTPAFVPSLKNYKSSPVKFSLKTVLRREYPGISATIISFVFVDFVRTWLFLGEPKWLLSHGVLVFIALLWSFVLRTLKHHTNFLRENDRS